MCKTTHCVSNETLHCVKNYTPCVKLDCGITQNYTRVLLFFLILKTMTILFMIIIIIIFNIMVIIIEYNHEHNHHHLHRTVILRPFPLMPAHSKREETPRVTLPRTQCGFGFFLFMIICSPLTQLHQKSYSSLMMDC